MTGKRKEDKDNQRERDSRKYKGNRDKMESRKYKGNTDKRDRLKDKQMEREIQNGKIREILTRQMEREREN